MLVNRKEVLSRIKQMQQALMEMEQLVANGVGRKETVTTEQIMAHIESGMKVPEIAKKYKISERAVYKKMHFRLKI